MRLNLQKERVIFYLKVGLAYFLIFLFEIAVNNPDTFGVRAVNTLWRVPYLIFINYVFFEVLLPLIKLKWRSLILSPFILMGQLFLCSMGLYVWRSLGVALNIHTSLIEFNSLSEGLSHQTGTGVFSVFFFGIIRHVYDYQKLKESAQLLRIQKQEAELNFLKSQTNPHFLFNTLNNIYSLARDKSDVAPESILRLSKILRYMLYDTVGGYIAIEKELKIIGDYIALEKLRYDESLQINFNYDVEDMKQAIPPLLLMPLVENAFKHGVSETRNHPYVDIHLSVSDRRLIFNLSKSVELSEKVPNVNENIGLSNLRRQLELLYRDYDLSVGHKTNNFTAKLEINLGSHV